MSSEKFTLVSGDTDFGSRSRNIFAGLELLEAQHSEFESSGEVRRESAALLKCDPTDELLLSVHNSSHSFAVPALPPPPKKKRCLSVPEFESNPAGWKFYDLSDVSVSQLSECSNVRAAHDFLDTQNANKKSINDVLEEQTMKCRSTETVRHVFHKPQHKITGEKESIKSAAQSDGVVSVNFDDDVVDGLLVSEEEQTLTKDVELTGHEDVEQMPPCVAKDSTLVFPSHITVRCRTERQQVRRRTADSDDESDDVTTTTTMVIGSSVSTTQSVATATNSSSKNVVADDDDEFTELAQLSSDSEEDDKPNPVDIDTVGDTYSPRHVDRQDDLQHQLSSHNYTDLETVE